jgi:hypothetical protein
VVAAGHDGNVIEAIGAAHLLELWLRHRAGYLQLSPPGLPSLGCCVVLVGHPSWRI